VAAQRAHARPVVAQAAGELGQQRVFLDHLVLMLVCEDWNLLELRISFS
jgi:extradiol dioxygenase family protein